MSLNTNTFENPYNAIPRSPYNTVVKSRNNIELNKLSKNTIKSRNNKSKTHFIKIIKSKSRDKNTSNPVTQCVINENKVKLIKVLSSGETGSGAIVYLVEELLTKRRFIIKETPLISKFDPDNRSFINETIQTITNEYVIYNTIMTTLVKNHITPFVIIGNGDVTCLEQDKIFLINETSNDLTTIETLSLKDLIDKYSRFIYELL
jgi:hypothetical protein